MTRKAPYWGNRLKALMELKDISPGKLAQLAGVTPTTVSKWQREDYPTLSAEKAALLEDIFQVPFYKIFPLEKPEPDKYDTPDVDRVALAGD